MRDYRLIVTLCCMALAGWCTGQGSGFSFSYTGPTQIIVGPDCIEPLNWGHPNTPTASSNLPGGMIVSFNIYSISGGYQIGDQIGGGTVVTVFYQAIDNFGNTALFGFSIAFIDVIPPVFDPLSLPANLTVNCTGNFPIANVEVSDNCDEQDIVLTVTFTETNNAQPCTGGVITRTWVADDDLGNLATFVQTITVLPDNTPPVIANNLVNGSAPCSTAMAQYTTWINQQRAAFSATDNGCGVMTLSDNAPPASQITSFCGVINVTFTAKDNCNNVSTVQRTFTITNNIAPVITTPAMNASGDCSQANINQVFNTWINSHGGAMATDDCSSIVWSTLPASPSLNDTCNAAIQVTFIAGDGCGNTASTTASFMLTDNTPPTFTTDPSSIVLSCTAANLDSLVMNWVVNSGQSQASDLCTATGDLVRGYRIGGIEHTLQQVMNAWQDSLDSPCRDNVIINGIGINNVKAHIGVQFTYTDNCGNQSGKTGFFGITDNGRPVFVSPPADTSLSCVEGEDWQSVFMNWYSTAGNAMYMDACSEVSVTATMTADSAIQYLTGVLDTACMQGAGVTIGFGLMDDCGNQSIDMPSASFSLQDTTAPVLIKHASDFMASCSADGQSQLVNWLDTLGGAGASDGCGALNWKFMWMDTSGQVLEGIPLTGPYPQVTSFECASGIDVIFIVEDICQNSVSDTATFSMIDTLPPVIIIEADSVHLLCHDTIPLETPVVTDGCGGEISLSFEDSGSGDICYGVPAIVIRTWTAEDACGNSSTAVVHYFRLDTLPPSFELPGDSVEFCSADTLALLHLADNCDPSPVSSFADVITGPACAQTLERTWTVSDACGNTATAVQVFDLSDTSPPSIVVSPGIFVYTCSMGNLQMSYEQWLASVTVEDACSEADYFIALPGTYDMADTTTWPGTPLADSVFLSCEEELLINGDLVVYDACGNVTVENISFSVNDTFPPVVLCPAVISVEPDTATCTGLAQIVAPTIEEICYPEDISLLLIINDGEPFEFDVSGSLDTILPVGVHSAIWVATDCKGNAGTCESLIEIIDENAISLNCPPDTILYAGEFSCRDSLWVYPPETTIGKCGKGAVELRFEIIGNATPSSEVFESAQDSVRIFFTAGFQQVLLIARDSTGDIDTCRYFIDLRDTILPRITCMTDSIFLHPSGAVDFDLSMSDIVLSAEDNCMVSQIVFDPPVVTCASAGMDLQVTVIAFDQSGNTDTCTASVFVTTIELNPIWERGLCDDTLRLFANLPDGPDVNYTFTWTGPNGFMSSEEDPVIPGIDSSFSGIYTLVVLSDSGCESKGFAVVEVETLSSPVIMLSDTLTCTGEEIIITANQFPGETSYQWFQINPAGDTLVNITGEPMFSFIPASPGTYFFFAIVTQDTCVSNPGPLVSLTVIDMPVALIGPVPATLCAYDTLFLSPAEIVDSLSYLWEGPMGFMSFDPAPAGIPASSLGSTSVFYLIVTNDACSSPRDSVIITILPTPDKPVIDGDMVTCENGSFTLHATGNADQYAWIDPEMNVILTGEDSLTIQPALESHEGPWRVVAIENGCRSDTSDAFAIQVDTILDIEIAAPTNACQGDIITLSVTPPVAGVYAWSGPGGFISNQMSPTVFAEEGNYMVSVTSGTSCVSSDTVFIHVDILPAITSLETDADSCADGSQDIRLWAVTIPSGGGDFNYFWTGPGGFTSLDSSPVIMNFNEELNGVYTLFIVNGVCTTDTATLLIEVTNSPAAPVVSGDTEYCFGDTIVLEILSPQPSAIYHWSTPGGNIDIPHPGTLTIADAQSSQSGTYSVAVNTGGCVSDLSSLTVTVKNALTTPDITTPALICEGDSLILQSTSPAGSSVVWFGPGGFTSMETTPVIYPALPEHAGMYAVAYSLDGCFSDTSQLFEINIVASILAPSIFSDLTAVCIDDPVPVRLCIENGSLIQGAAYTWLLNGSTVLQAGVTDSCIEINGALLSGGTNMITAITSVQGCASDQSLALEITGDAFPSVIADAGPDTQFCPGEVIMLDADDPFPASGVWTTDSELITFEDPSSSSTTVPGLPSGEYQINWTLSFASCMNYSMDAVTITVVPSPVLIADTVTVPFGITVDFAATINDSLHGLPFTIQVVSPPQRGNVLHTGNGVYRYSPFIGFVGTDMMTYRICLTDCPEECKEAIVILRVGDEDDCFTPTLFTPNGDGVNDVLIIPCLETARYPSNRIIVFNEWGDAVFTASPYQNNWDGRFSGDPLPVGTYFYIMDFGDGSTPKRTFLVLER